MSRIIPTKVPTPTGFTYAPTQDLEETSQLVFYIIGGVTCIFVVIMFFFGHCIHTELYLMPLLLCAYLAYG